MVLVMRTNKMRVTSTHPDFTVAAHQSCEARRYGNTMNFVARLMDAQRQTNYEYNKNCTDKTKLIPSPYTFMDPLYEDQRLLEIPGVVDWIKQYPYCKFDHKYNFTTLGKLIAPQLNIDLNTV